MKKKKKDEDEQFRVSTISGLPLEKVVNTCTYCYYYHRLGQLYKLLYVHVLADANILFPNDDIAV